MGARGSVNVSNLFISLPSQIGSGTAYSILKDYTTTGASATIDTGTFDLKGTTDLKIRALLKAPSGAANALIRFNDDSGAAAYEWGYLMRQAGNDVDAADSSIKTTNSVAVACSISMDVMNVAALNKEVNGSKTGVIQSVFWGSWFNTTDQINRVQIITGNAETFPAGCRIIVMGV